MALARLFDGVDDVITDTITTMDSGDWTFIAWINPTSAGEGGLGQILRTDPNSGNFRQLIRLNAGLTPSAHQRHDTTIAVSVASTALVAGEWACVAGTYRDSDDTCRVYVGSPMSAMAEVSYSSVTAGGGARTTNSTNARIGNNNTGSTTFDGLIGPCVMAAQEWTTAEMDAFRLGLFGPFTNLRGVWMMDDRDAATVINLATATAATVTGCTLADGPPVGYCRHARLHHVPFARTGVQVR